MGHSLDEFFHADGAKLHGETVIKPTRQQVEEAVKRGCLAKEGGWS